jgi:hypothetical protein
MDKRYFANTLNLEINCNLNRASTYRINTQKGLFYGYFGSFFEIKFRYLKMALRVKKLIE